VRIAIEVVIGAISGIALAAVLIYTIKVIWS
jgi:hypothetical protein